MAELHPNSETPTSKIVREIRTICSRELQYLCEDGSVWSVNQVDDFDNETKEKTTFIYWIKCMWFDHENKTYHQISEQEYNERRKELATTGITILSERRKGKQ